MLIEKKLPKVVLEKIRSYYELNIDGFIIRCPYFINKSKFNLWKNISYLGKGDSQEIIEETKRLIDKDKMLSKEKSSNLIRNYMKENNLGIDCSGFVTRILDCWCREKYGESLFLKVNIKLPFAKKFKYFLRPFENTSVKIILNHFGENIVINRSGDIKPGDLIHLGQTHILVVSEIIQDSRDSQAKEINYFHSSSHFDGIHKGKIKIKNPKAKLGEQFWEGEENNWTNQQFIKYPDSGVIRLKIFDDDNDK
jgi:hypothetical protein